MKLEIDARTSGYFKAIKDNLGLLGMNSGWKSLAIVLEEKSIQYETDSREVRGRYFTEYIYKRDSKQRYAYEYVLCGGEDYRIISYVTTKPLSSEDLETLLLITKIEDYLILGKLCPVFLCWECGHETHWLDIPAKNLSEKYERWIEHYCGRC